jgi:HlyD family secretion protein
MKTVIRLGILAIVLGVFGYTMYFLYQKNEAPDTMFHTETAYTSNILVKTVATGSVVPRQEILIKPVVSGIIDKIYLEAGEMVKKGDVIARVKIIPDMVNLNNAENRVERAKIDLDNTKIEHDRNEKLFKDAVISYAEFQPFELRLKNARLELTAAQDNLAIIKEGVSKTSKSASNTLVKSTITGMVLDVPVKEGNQVIEANTFNEGTTIASVANMADMIFQGNLDESEVGKVKENMDLILTIGALQDLSLGAKLEYIAPKGVEENGAIQFEIKAKINPEDLNANFIRSGYSANASIVLDRADSVMVIKEGLVEYTADSAYVYVETKPQVFEKRNITVGLSDGIQVEVKSGITADDKLRSRQMSPEEVTALKAKKK